MPQKCSCGTYNKDAAKFCRNCGKRLYYTPNIPNHGHTESKTTTRNNNSSLGQSPDAIKILLVLICIGAVIGGFVLFMNGAISKVLGMGIVFGGILGIKELFKN